MSSEPGKDEHEIPAGGGNAFDKCFANLWESAKNPDATEEYLDVLEQDIYDLDPQLLDTLLQDKTTGGYILWACDEYAANGEAYAADREMTPDLIIGKHTTLIQPRVAKSREEQRKRTRKSAEVFSPAWLCNEMAGLCDEEWFGRKDVFNAPSPGHLWQAAPAPIRFPSGKTWQGYVGRTCLELACGEAPFLVSRYDAASGAFIPVEKRVGLLDRKLRVIGERVRTEKSWFRHALRAFKSTYGYEYQGDNLLLARENLLWSFVDFYRARWQHAPSMSQLLKVADVIAWNIWQMDGLTDSVPFAQTDTSQLDLFLFADRDALSPSTRCKIRLWPLRKNLYLKQLKGTPSMKFDVVIGNPPYQITNEKTSDTPVYNLFMDSASDLSDIVVMITPARFLFNAGKTPEEWNQKMLNDEHFKVVEYKSDSSEYFPNVDIKGGACISIRNVNADYGKIISYTAHEELNKILKKVLNYPIFSSISSIIYAQNKFNLEVLYGDYPELRKIIGSQGREKRLTTSIFTQLSVFEEEKRAENQLRILGLIKNIRTYRYVDEKYIDEHVNIDKYKVILPKSNGSGAFGECLSTPVLGIPGLGYTQSFLGIGSFENKFEAEATLKYIKTKLLRTLLGVLKVTQHNPQEVWRFVPLQDFTAQSDIDWSRPIPDIDRQLYRKYGLNAEEIQFIEKNIKPME